MGYAAGQAYLNVNRDALHPETRLWYQGPNPDGPSDKTVAVVKFESLSGDPIAAYVNYAMHSVLMFMRNEITGDVPGAMSRYVEDAFDERVVAIFTQGASGDQNPIYTRLAEPAIAAVKRPEVAASGGETDVISVANFTGATLDPKVLDRGARLMDSMGQILGEEVIRVIRITASRVADGNVDRTRPLCDHP